MKRVMVIAVLAGAVAGCLLAGLMVLAPSAATLDDGEWTAATLEDGEWTLVSWSDDAELPEQAITFALSDGQVSGSTSCNNYFGPVTIDGQKIAIGDMVTTRMFCFDTAEAESTYLDLLSTVTTWSQDGAALVLLGDGEQVLRFES